ncbi:zinc metalloprotease HtpX [Pseudalkalibacillus sp. SCS-8]|uniref:zinc metalloprotease HtpX n=1 Tax=Pseudalkalibacillus nanhaiensis TaxID=3115291 RepID=UPI0032DB27B0
MYIIDLLQRLVKKQNIGIIVFLILNTFLVIALFGDPITGIVLYTASLLIALSPIGEWILRVQQGCKKLARKEHIERLEPLFNEVYEKAKKLDPTIPDNVQLFISNDSSPNAFATGRKTICLTKGLLEYSDEEIKATLAHEFGHLSNKDTDLILLVTVGNMIVTAMFVLYRVIVSAIGIGVSIANRSFGSLIVTFLIDVVLVGLMWLWTKFGTVLVMNSVRKNEYEADKFAYDCGYGNELIVVLDKFNAMDTGATKGLWANLSSTHPDPDQRIGNLQKLDDVA